MKILLFITSIYNTLDKGDLVDYKQLIDNLNKIKALNNNDIVFISFCDTIENKNIMLFYVRKLIDHMEYKKIFFGEQFLGDVYYSGLNGGAVMYDDSKMDKLDKIINYVKKLESNGNKVELIIVDGNMNIQEYKKRVEKSLTCPCTFIYNISNLREINKKLDELYNGNEKRLRLKN